MKKIFFNLSLAALFMTTQILSSCVEENENKPPQAQKIPKELKIHSDIRIDNYYWLNQRENQKVIDYLKAENEYTTKSLSHTEALQSKIFDEITSRIKPRDKSVPFRDNGYYYYQRYEPQQEQPIYCRYVDTVEAKEEIMLDVNKMALGFPFFEVEDYSISPNNDIIAFSVDTLGRRKYEIRFKNLSTGDMLTDIIPDCGGAPVWSNDNKTVFYIKKDPETLREYKVCKHVLGTSYTDDIDVFIEEDEAFDVDLSRSKSEKYIFISSYSTLSTEFQYLDASTPNGDFKLINKREDDHEYFVEHSEGQFYILTNKNAKNFKFCATPENKTESKYWKDIISEQENVLIEDFDVFEDFVVLKQRSEGLIKLKVINKSDYSSYIIELGEDVYETWLKDNYEYNSDTLRYGYSSLTTPTSYFNFNMKTKETVLLKQKEVGPDFSSDNYESKRLFATATDGTKIPISIVYKKGIILNSQNPLLIYGYGSYGYSLDAYFMSSLLSLLDRGFVYAIAHVRGGQEMGRKWYDDGKLLNKKNTFTDFIACTKFLQEKKYSKPEITFAEGGSAGGLLVGAVVNMAPELYTGIIAEVPFVDVITTMLDKSIPLTTSEFDEWGNPEIKKYYKYMLSYSPYDQIKKMSYPSIFVTAGLHDSQVQYWEPAKWVAKLREYNTSENPIYLKVNMDAGHGGASGRYEPYKETALSYAFMLDVLKKYSDK